MGYYRMNANGTCSWIEPGCGVLPVGESWELNGYIYEKKGHPFYTPNCITDSREECEAFKDPRILINEESNPMSSVRYLEKLLLEKRVSGHAIRKHYRRAIGLEPNNIKQYDN